MKCKNTRELNESNWERYAHYNYYKDKVKSGYTMTVKLDVKNLLSFKKSHDFKLSNLIYYCICRALNREHNFNFRIVDDGSLFAYDNVNVLFTIFHEDDNTFSNVWVKNNDNLVEFNKEVELIKRKYKDVHGVSVVKEKPKNCVPISIIPWAHFEGFCSDLFEETKNCFPLITIGKIEENSMPVSIYVKHCVADGFHVSRLFKDIQEEFDFLGKQGDI